MNDARPPHHRDNVHRLHGTDHETVHEDVQDDVQPIIHVNAERVEPVNDGDVHDGDVHDGDDGVHVLSDEESAELDRRLESRGAVVVRRAMAPARVAKSAAVAVKSHEPTVKVGKAMLRHIVHGRAGCGVVRRSGRGTRPRWVSTGARSRPLRRSVTGRR